MSAFQVWAHGILVSNVSEEEPVWMVRGLSPDTNFRLRVYRATQHARSPAVVIYARTLNNQGPSISGKL